MWFTCLKCLAEIAASINSLKIYNGQRMIPTKLTWKTFSLKTLKSFFLFLCNFAKQQETTFKLYGICYQNFFCYWHLPHKQALKSPNKSFFLFLLFFIYQIHYFCFANLLSCCSCSPSSFCFLKWFSNSSICFSYSYSRMPLIKFKIFQRSGKTEKNIKKYYFFLFCFKWKFICEHKTTRKVNLPG